MGKAKSIESYPAFVVIISNLVSVVIYGTGFLLLLKTGILFSFIYLLYVLILEIRLIKNHCTNCYYWGKTCGFGKGRISSLFFRKGDVSRFCNNKITWTNMIPDVLVWLIPFLTGVVLLFQSFNWAVMISMLILLIFSFAGNAFVRGKLTCGVCRQKEIGCPADQLFNKK